MDYAKTLQELSSAKQRTVEQMHRVIVGQDETIERILLGLFAGGHCLLVGVPGLAKTLMVRTLSRILDLSFKRIQFTPDIMPADITGIEILQEESGTLQREMRFVPGPVFANIVLSDEINRAPPKTQAALLEAMQEYQVTSGGKTYRLPRPFLVLATQNPIELEGTYPLPEAQLDRFMFSIWLDYPSPAEEKLIAEHNTDENAVGTEKILPADAIQGFQSLVRQIPVSDFVVSYAVRLVRATRPQEEKAPDFVKEYVSWGAGPRATQYLVLAAKTLAAFRGDVNVATADVRNAAESVLRHRVFINYSGDAAGVDSRTVVRRLTESLPEAE